MAAPTSRGLAIDSYRTEVRSVGWAGAAKRLAVEVAQFVHSLVERILDGLAEQEVSYCLAKISKDRR